MNWENYSRVSLIFNEFVLRNNIENFYASNDCSICNGWLGKALALSAMSKDNLFEKGHLDFDHLINIKFKELNFFIENTFDISIVSGLSGTLWALSELRGVVISCRSKLAIFKRRTNMAGFTTWCLCNTPSGRQYLLPCGNLWFPYIR